MEINIKHLPAGAAPLEVCADLDLSSLRRFGESPLGEPVRVKAVFTGGNGAVMLRYTADYTLQTACARCLEPIRQTERLEVRHALMETMADEKSDGYILVPDSILDLDALVQADLSLALSGVALCNEDCKGLCPTCGANRNKQECNCGKKEPDPRFAALRALLEGKED